MTELEQKRAIEEWDVDIIVSTYKDNPFLDANLVKEIERLEKIDPAYWNIYWLGNYWKLEGLVFPRRTEIGEIPEWFDFLWYWQDFWYTNDPTTVVGLYKKWDDILFDEVIYKTWLTNQDIIIEYENNSIGRSDEIVADSAEPKSIAEQRSYGLNVVGCEKGKDSVSFRIKVTSQKKIYVTKRSKNIWESYENYRWAEDKDGNPKGVPEHTYSHAMDAVSYAVSSMHNRTNDFDIIYDTKPNERKNPAR